MKVGKRGKGRMGGAGCIHTGHYSLAALWTGFRGGTRSQRPVKRRMTLAGLGRGLPGPAGGLDNMGGGREGGMGVTPICPPTGCLRSWQRARTLHLQLSGHSCTSMAAVQSCPQGPLLLPPLLPWHQWGKPPRTRPAAWGLSLSSQPGAPVFTRVLHESEQRRPCCTDQSVPVGQ